jgi:hypothetical protein
MKPRRLGALLALLLALAVPLQGFAAVSAVLCMAQSQDASVTPHHDSHDRHDHPGRDQDRAKSAGHACSACAACCSSAAISYAMAPVLTAPHAMRAEALAAPSFAGIPPVSLDRPPQ